MSAVAPMAHKPQPETAVNAELRSMVCRMTGRCSITAGPGGAVGRAVLRRHGRESNIGRKLTPGSRAFVKHHMATEDDSNLNSLLRITTFGYGPRGEPPIVRRARDSSGEPSSECAHAGGPGYRCRRDDISNDASSIHALPRRVALLLRRSDSCNNYLSPPLPTQPVPKQ